MAELLLFLQLFLIFSFCAGYVYFYHRTKSAIQIIIDICFLALIFGTPLLFTSLTRSVFEVTKLMLLRYTQLIIIFSIFVASVLKIPTSFHGDNLKGFAWSRLHWIWGAWLAVNLISFGISPNSYVSWIGAYDRWEGILTVTNYVVLLYLLVRTIKHPHQVLWFFLAFFCSGLLTTIYGAFQSTGHDFMNWSVDPTSRVFASINNPVHYSAYVAMLVPTLIGILFYLVKINRIDFLSVRKNLSQMSTNRMFVSVVVLFFGIMFFYYVSSFLSFGRATWIGFSTAMMVLYFFLMQLYVFKKIFLSAILYLGGVFLANAIFVFKVQEFSALAMVVIVALFTILITLQIVMLKNIKKTLSAWAILVFFGYLQFCTVSLLSIAFCTMALFALFVMQNRKVYFKISFCLAVLMMLILVLPSFNLLIVQAQFKLRLNSIYAQKEKEYSRKLTVSERLNFRNIEFDKLRQENKVSKTETNVYLKTASYDSNLKTGTARTSMWRSAIGLSPDAFKDPNFHMWVKDYPVLGTGPGTIKAFFPRYRRPEYGRLEGGHNFTPDKLHNDYVNLIATNGLLGFVVYYLMFIPYCGYLFIKRLKEYPNAPSNYLLIGLISGLLVYLGQVMFNFGVVATRVLFYELLGLAMAIVLNNPFKDVKVQNQEDIK